MRVFLTGADGFVGRWLRGELTTAGHEVVDPGRRVDVTDREGLHAALVATNPDVVGHLAAVAYAPDAGSDPGHAFEVNVGGTINLIESVRALPTRPAILVTGSSEVYGAPRIADLPLSETAAMAPRNAYALSKAAQEGVALSAGRRHGISVIVTRSFNHTGPGQRPVFVVPAMAQRVLAIQRGEMSEIRAGNVDVRRDFLDVRDVVRAYRLLLERAQRGEVGSDGEIYNVAAGRSVTIREIIARFCELAQVPQNIVTDPALVRPYDPVDIRGDATALTRVTGWAPQHRFDETLAEVWEATAADAGAREVPSPAAVGGKG